MTGRDFLDVADELATGAHEGHWRSAVSRAYYAAFHFARDLFHRCGFAVPRAERAHNYLSMRLSNCGHPDVIVAGKRLDDLRQARNRADYDLSPPLGEEEAVKLVDVAAGVVRTLDEAAGNTPLLTRITQAMRDYERDVLQDVTWRGP
jgi:uncharacterized protein (UPF0332 family)